MQAVFKSLKGCRVEDVAEHSFCLASKGEMKKKE